MNDVEQETLTELSLSLGQVRAEYSSDEDVFSMFSWPVYWGELTGTRPCFLVGGRGTGKTTTLRGLSYGGQASLLGNDLGNWHAIGAYWRIDANVASSFRGREISEETWIRAFSHYTNLKLVGLFTAFCQWRFKATGAQTVISADGIQLACITLNLQHEVETIDALAREVKIALARLQARLNGPPEELKTSHFSVLGVPVAHLLDAIEPSDDAARLPFAFCIDEFENLQPYQQRVLNTLVKHVGDSRFTVKIGVRDSISRERSTLASAQPLVDPADYTSVEIVEHLKEQSFVDFAARVCELRLGRTSSEFLRGLSMQEAFPSLTMNEEAALLGGTKERQRIRRRIEQAGGTSQELETFDSLGLLSACMVGYWARSKGAHERDILGEVIGNEVAWRTRLGNYSYAMLFTLRNNVRGIRKYYAGWQTYCQLADGNIRLILQLAYEALRLHLTTNQTPSSAISPKDQTLAAEKVGRTALRELQGLSEIGGQLTRLTLSLGRVFNVMAVAPEGHTPEVNQVHVDRDGLVGSAEDLDLLLAQGVAHGCLLSFASDKQERVSAQTKSDDYQLHPVFAPYFVYSHRRKRRIQVSGDDMLALASTSPARTIERLIGSRKRDIPRLPVQLDFYADLFEVRE